VNNEDLVHHARHNFFVVGSSGSRMPIESSMLDNCGLIDGKTSLYKFLNPAKLKIFWANDQLFCDLCDSCELWPVWLMWLMSIDHVTLVTLVSKNILSKWPASKLFRDSCDSIMWLEWLLWLVWLMWLEWLMWIDHVTLVTLVTRVTRSCDLCD
jgi:hypothetical protein